MKYLRYLLILIPVSIVFEFMHLSPTLIFITSLLQLYLWRDSWEKLQKKYQCIQGLE